MLSMKVAKKTRMGNGKKPPWWTYTLTKLKKEVNKLKRRMERQDSPEATELFREKRNEYKREVKSAKKTGWFNLCTEMKNLTSVARLQKALKMGKKEDIGNIKKPDGSYTETPHETLKVLLDAHFPSANRGGGQAPRGNKPSGHK